MNHVVCHIYPKVGSTWRTIVDGLRKRQSMFDGKRIIGIVTGENLENPDTVKKELSDFGTHWIINANDPGLREVVTLRPAIDELMKDPSGNAFYCHSKGATHSPDSICQEWREVMLSVCLDFPALINAALADRPICGPFRRYGGLGVEWHYSGAFYWFRLEDLWMREWRYVQNTWYGVETFPACNFHPPEARCLFLDHCGDLYDPDYWDRVVRPAFDIWKKRIAACL